VVERPVSNATESLVQADSFMDVLAVTWKLQRTAAQRVEAGLTAYLRFWGVPTRRDVAELVNQVASLQREVRELRREADID
jgi:hypothetical protein